MRIFNIIGLGLGVLLGAFGAFVSEGQILAMGGTAIFFFGMALIAEKYPHSWS